MRNLVLILSIILIPLKAYGFEDYIIVSDKPVELVSSDDREILDVSPFFTIDNNKNSIFVKAKKEGKCRIFITTEDGINTIEAEIVPEKTFLSDSEGFTYFSLDKPEKVFGTPPEIREAE